ncbi:hypothetical protein [Ferrimicrobium acidiphilum]|uniref:hypothetical protein n=1 Tax=Ferrimicrobium acidiphilum TaxID=121039 RepID=UPI001269F291|nr:hypothetical protein [Ferrimicrobium acidiphilum]
MAIHLRTLNNLPIPGRSWYRNTAYFRRSSFPVASGLAVDLDVGGPTGLDPDGASDSRVTDRSAALVTRATRGDLVDAGGEIDAEGAVYCGVPL